MLMHCNKAVFMLIQGYNLITSSITSLNIYGFTKYDINF